MPQTVRITLGLLLVVSGGAGGFLEGRRPTAEARAQPSAVERQRTADTSRNGALAFGRTELFFGSLKPHGTVTDAEFEAFVDEHVTRRFPDGLTVVKGSGQFRGEDRIIRKEAAFVMILLYPDETRERSSRKLNEIREIYKDLFQQQSVLRVDDPFVVWVSF